MIYFESQVQIMLAAKDGELRALRETVDRLTVELKQERIRANNAIDVLLKANNQPAVTPAPNRENEGESFENKVLRMVSNIGGDEEGGVIASAIND